jgi:hydroxypyruvate isomerase
MPKLAANITLLFADVPFIERPAAAAAAGFTALECQLPYAVPAEDLRRELQKHSVSMVLHNLPAGDWAAGERGIACLPDRVDEFKAGVDKALSYADALQCRQINCLAGLTPADGNTDNARDTLIRNLRYAAPRLASAGISLLIEPLNTRDVPGFFLTGTAQALDIIDAVGAPNLYLQYDAYHMQVMEGDVATAIPRLLSRIGHIQIADEPGRHEPGTGAMDYATLLPSLDRLGYRGWVGCEYNPAGTTAAGLGWASPYLSARPESR